MAATVAIRLGRSNFHRATKIHRPDPLAQTRERGLSLPATMHRRLVGVMWIAAACLLIGCTDREIAEDGDEDVVPFADEVIRVPATLPLLMPLLTIVPLQIFALHLATAKGLDVDQPRNLAKSVTVE